MKIYQKVFKNMVLHGHKLSLNFAKEEPKMLWQRDGMENLRILMVIQVKFIIMMRIKINRVFSNCNKENNEKIHSLGPKSEIEENDDSESKSDVDDYIYTRQWSVKDDKTLKDLIIKKQIYDWQALSRYFNTSPKQVIKRWQKQIYPQIKIKTKVAGALRWSKQEDSILVGCQKDLGCDWEAINIFIPSRSVFSIEGRWRRISKNEVQMNSLNLTSVQDIQNKKKMMNKYQYRKYIIRLIGQKIEQGPIQINTNK